MATSHRSRPVLAADLTVPNLILVGLPGSGKSTVGRALANALGRDFLDFDVEIERRQGVTVSEIFGERGEAAFRALEVALTRELKDSANLVLAPGGGWITNPGCLELLRPPAQVIYLQIDPARALERMAAEAANRPLLRHPNPLQQLERLLAARNDLYLLADHTLRVDALGEKEVVVHIVALASRPLGD